MTSRTFLNSWLSWVPGDINQIRIISSINVLIHLIISTFVPCECQVVENTSHIFACVRPMVLTKCQRWEGYFCRRLDCRYRSGLSNIRECKFIKKQPLKRFWLLWPLVHLTSLEWRMRWWGRRRWSQSPLSGSKIAFPQCSQRSPNRRSHVLWSTRNNLQH